MTTSAQRGFTLVETLVAITILMIAIVIPFNGVHQAITVSYVSRDQLIASALAQEAVEYAYFIRGSNYLYYLQTGGTYPGANGWLSNLQECLVSLHAYGCAVDAAQGTTAACSSSGCAVLNLSQANIYTQSTSGNTPTRFTRTMKIEEVNTHEARVTVTVSWRTLNRDYTTTTTENIYNWL